MKRIALMITLVIPATAFAGGRSYNAEATITHDCAKEPDVSVNSSGAKATFTGTCDKISLNGSKLAVTIENVRKLSINGASNTVDIGGVDKLAVNGSANTVNYKQSVAGGKPKVVTTGAGNKVTRVK
jgi:hypothetical protein